MRDWTAEEKKSITDLLKRIPAANRPSVRDTVKDMQADEAISYIKGLKAPEKPFKPSKASEGINTPIQTEKTQDAGDQDTQDQVKLERVQGETSSPYYFNLEEIKDRIRQTINEYLLIHDMEQSDMIKAPQRIFGALSDYIGEKVFKDTKILKMTPYDDKGAYITNNNAYDVDKIADILGFYFTLCKEYNKAFLLDYAAGFLGITEQTLYNISDKLTSAGFELGKKRENSLAAGIVDGKQSPVGALAALNHWHGWSGTSSNRTEVRETTVVYPVLVDINKSSRETIPDKQSQ